MPDRLIVPESPRDLGLPKDTWLEGQRETVQAVLDAFIDGVKFVMLSVPTGGGKSLIGAAVQVMLQKMGGGDMKSVALTHTIQLQKQYLDTLPSASVLSGRANHLCALPEDAVGRVGFGMTLTAADAPCSEGEECEIEGNLKKSACAYYAQFYEGMDAPMLVGNYAYATRILQLPYVPAGIIRSDGKQGVIPNPFRRELLIADECHLTEQALVESSGVQISAYMLSQLGLSLPSPVTRTRVQEGRSVKEYETTAVWVAWARKADKVVGEAARILHTETLQLKELLKERWSQETVERLAKARMKYKRMCKLKDNLALLTNLREEEYGGWIVRRDTGYKGDVTSITVQPLWGSAVAEERLWRHFDKVLLMSATPGEPALERMKLGIPEEKFRFIERPSTFPVKNRPIFYWPVAKLSYTSSDNDWARVADAIAQIATSGQWAERKGLVHSGSKKNAERLVGLLNARVPGQRFFTHGSKKGEAAAALEVFKQSPLPLVLVTASFTTGLDIPYLIGWQIIAKCPFGSLGDEITARRRAFVTADGVKLGERVYRSEAMNTVVQAAGRIVRTLTDSGPTFILDANYDMLHRLAWKPQFYTEAYKQLSVTG